MFKKMQQQSPQMFPAMVPSIPSSNITTEQIQKVSSFFPLCMFRVLLRYFCENVLASLFFYFVFKSPVLDIEIRCLVVFFLYLIYPLHVLKFQYLDENKKLIMAIMENQNLGKLAECAQ